MLLWNLTCNTGIFMLYRNLICCTGTLHMFYRNLICCTVTLHVVHVVLKPLHIVLEPNMMSWNLKCTILYMLYWNLYIFYWNLNLFYWNHNMFYWNLYMFYWNFTCFTGTLYVLLEPLHVLIEPDLLYWSLACTCCTGTLHVVLKLKLQDLRSSERIKLPGGEVGECEDGKKMEVMGKIIFPICWNSMCLKGKIGDDLRDETARGEGGGFYGAGEEMPDENRIVLVWCSSKPGLWPNLFIFYKTAF